MNLLHLIFKALKPEQKTTWLSRRFSRWEIERHDKGNAQYLKTNTRPSVYFKVPGAGNICMSESCHHTTGRVVGFSFGVEWGIHGYCSGVIGRDEAKRMAEFILQKCAETAETMREERARMEIEREIYRKSTSRDIN